MSKEKFLTVRWNNLLALGLGIPVLAYTAAVLTIPVMSGLGSFIGMVVIAVLY